LFKNPNLLAKLANSHSATTFSKSLMALSTILPFGYKLETSFGCMVAVFCKIKQKRV
jgi:hypothetical protein